MTELDGRKAATEDIAALTSDAFVFCYPLVLMELTRRQMTTPGSKALPGRGHVPMNTFAHIPVVPDASFEGVVSPNVDTLYSIAWLDLSNGPVELCVPDTGDRYYMLELLDAWTNVFACPGTRTSGNGAGRFVLVGPDWSGVLSEGAHRIDAPTAVVWIIGRTYTAGVEDYPAVHAVQAGYQLAPFAANTAPTPTAGPGPVDLAAAPADQVAAMDPATYFALASHLMAANPPRPADAPALERFSRIGLTPAEFNGDALDEAAQGLIAQGAADGLARVVAAGRVPRASMHEGWITAHDLGEYGTDYLHRAGVAWVGLGANPPEDALYPLCRTDADGEVLDGRNRYVLHFAADTLPPADAFWSLTLYNERQFFHDNPLNRYALGDRNPLRFDADGGLTLLIQHTSPGKQAESNWLPAPEGPFNLMMRLYQPRPEALNGTWRTPGVQRSA